VGSRHRRPSYLSRNSGDLTGQADLSSSSCSSPEHSDDPTLTESTHTTARASFVAASSPQNNPDANADISAPRRASRIGQRQRPLSNDVLSRLAPQVGNARRLSMQLRSQQSPSATTEACDPSPPSPSSCSSALSSASSSGESLGSSSPLPSPAASPLVAPLEQPADATAQVDSLSPSARDDPHRFRTRSRLVCGSAALSVGPEALALCIASESRQRTLAAWDGDHARITLSSVAGEPAVGEPWIESLEVHGDPLSCVGGASACSSEATAQPDAVCAASARWLARLALSQPTDSPFVSAFLHVYSYLGSEVDFVHFYLQLLSVNPQSSESQSISIEPSVVFHLLEKWIELHASLFRASPDVVQSIRHELDSSTSACAELKLHIERLLEHLDSSLESSSGQSAENHVPFANAQVSLPNAVDTDSIEACRNRVAPFLKELESCPAAQVAAAIAEQEYDLWRAIQPYELIHGVSSGGQQELRAPHVHTYHMVTQQRISTVVCSVLFGGKTYKQRAMVLRQWLRVGEELCKLKCFVALDDLLLALKHPDLQALRKEWKTLSSEETTLFDSLRKATTSALNPASKRLTLTRCLSILAEAEQLDSVIAPGLLNWTRLARIGETIHCWTNRLERTTSLARGNAQARKLIRTALSFSTTDERTVAAGLVASGSGRRTATSSSGEESGHSPARKAGNRRATSKKKSHTDKVPPSIPVRKASRLSVETTPESARRQAGAPPAAVPEGDILARSSELRLQAQLKIQAARMEALEREIEAGEAKCSLLVKSYDSLLSNSSSASGSLALPIPCAELTQKVSDLRELYEAQTANEAKLAELRSRNVHLLHSIESGVSLNSLLHSQLREIQRHLSKYEDVMGSGSVSGAKVELAQYCLESVLAIMNSVRASKPTSSTSTST